MLSIKNLKMYFFSLDGIVRAVDDVSFVIRKKEIVGLVGESGCGKTMTCRSIVRLVPFPGRIIEGEIMFDGINLLDLNSEEMRGIRGQWISMIFQNPLPFLNPVMKVKDQIAEVILEKSKMTKREAYAEVVKMLEKVNVSSPEQVADYYPHQLSGGMCQRVLISIALVSRPKLLIADEPTTALDTTIQKQITLLMQELKNDFGMSILMITHNLALASEICDKIMIMYAGKIVEIADTYTLFENPLHPYTKMLLECVPRPDETKEISYIPGTVPNLMNLPTGCSFHPRCPKAINKCMVKAPPIEDLSNHFVACWVR